MKFKQQRLMEYLGDHLVESRNTQNASTVYDGAFFDSREVLPGCIFVAIDGKKSAGVKYVQAAIDLGATAVVANIKYAEELAETIKKNESRCCFFLVDDSLLVFGLMGKLAREQYDRDVIGVIGSVGKTTTKNMLRELGGGQLVAHASRGSYNNQTGVPLTLCALPIDARRAIIELGESHFGDLTYITEISQPSMVVVTNVDLAHTEFLGDTLGVAKTMNETIALLNEESTVILPIDIVHRDVVLGDTKAQVVFVRDEGSSSIADGEKYSDAQVAIISQTHARDDLTHDMTLDFDGHQISLHVPLVGRHFVMDAALAIVASLLCGDTAEDLILRIENVAPQGHRMKVIETEMVTVIDDCYNANPASMKASMNAVAALAREKTKRSVFVMGPMRELGENSDSLHREMGLHAASQGIDVLICVDPATKSASDESAHPDSYYFPTVDQCCEKIASLVQRGDLVGVKASRGPDPDEPAMVPIVEKLAELQ